MFVIAGKAGAGKSTLINNLLGLKGKKAAESKARPKSVTKTIDYFEEEVHGIKVCIIDIPGLEAKDLTSKEEQEILEDLSALTNGKVDIMLYCIKLTDRPDEKDKQIIKKSTKVFGDEIWKHTVLVLTFGDAILHQDEGDRDTLEELANEFEEVLKKAGVNDVPVKSILSAQDTNSELESVQRPEIIGIPVGLHTETPKDWVLLLFKEIIKKCKTDSIPMKPQWIDAVITLGGFVGGSVGLLGGAAAGATAGASVGGFVGGAIGAVFGGIGSKSGAAVGAWIGEGIGALTGIMTGSVTGVMVATVTLSVTQKFGNKSTGFAAIIRARQSTVKKKTIGKVKKANRGGA